MQVIRQIVDREKIDQISVPDSYGRRVKVIILPLPEREASLTQDSLRLMKLQEQSGFAQRILADATEDVWNDV